MGNELKELYSDKNVNVHNAGLEEVDQSILIKLIAFTLKF